MTGVRRPKPLGDVATSIMAVLADGDLHGYAILAEVRLLSDGGVKLGTGTLYGALERLQDACMVVVADQEVVDGRLRRYYRLTERGRAALVAELDRRAQLLAAARHRLAGAS
jgi:DNA-binding PadR family transcriptional regulator